MYSHSQLCRPLYSNENQVQPFAPVLSWMCSGLHLQIQAAGRFLELFPYNLNNDNKVMATESCSPKEQILVLGQVVQADSQLLSVAAAGNA